MGFRPIIARPLVKQGLVGATDNKERINPGSPVPTSSGDHHFYSESCRMRAPICSKF